MLLLKLLLFTNTIATEQYSHSLFPGMPGNWLTRKPRFDDNRS